MSIRQGESVPRAGETSAGRVPTPAGWLRTVGLGAAFALVGAVGACVKRSGDGAAGAVDPPVKPLSAPTSATSPSAAGTQAAPAAALPRAATRTLADRPGTDPRAPASARFVAFGDSGTGTDAQRRVAEQIPVTCKTLGCGFAVHLGDIFYTVGPTTTADPRYIEWWEKPYGGLGLDFYISLGNHDYYGDPEASLAWTALSPSKRWILPARYYTYFRDGVRFLVLDTNQPTDEQAEFFRGVLRDSHKRGERWVVAYGHHPRISVGRHGDAEGELAAWWDSLLCGRVDLFLAGHDHDMQVLKPRCGVELAVSGAASMLRDVSPSDASIFAASTLGFAVVELLGDAGRLRFFDVFGATEYDHQWKRRTQAACLADKRCDGQCDSDPTCRPASPH